MILLVLFGVALLVRVAVGTAFAGPAYPDSYYYFSVAHQLASGHGLSLDYIWNFVDVGGRLPAQPGLPIASNAHWMPLASFVQVPFIWLLGPGWLSAGLPMWLVGAAAAPLAYVIGRDAGFGRQPALIGGLLTAVPGGMTPFLGQPDNFGLFMTLGATSLWLCARGLRGDRRAFMVGGLVVGLATLSRSDGVLLGIPFALAGLRELFARPRVVGLAAVFGCAALFILTVAPWLWRQLEVFGSISPSASSGRILWIANYGELFSITSPTTPERLLANGWGAFLAGRLGGLVSALAQFALLPLVIVLTPLAALGAWLHGHDVTFRPFLVYALAFFAACGLVFAVHVPYGNFIHSAVALLPHSFVLVVAGIGGAVAWVAARRPTWNVDRATAFFGYGAVAVVIAGAVVQSFITIGHWSDVRVVQARLAAALATVPVGDRVMSADAGAYRYLSGHPGVVSPNDDLATIEDVLRAYDVRWLVLERDSIVPALAPVLSGEVRPAWLSAPVASVSGGGGASASTVPMTPAPAGALYAVCLEPTDERCGP